MSLLEVEGLTKSFGRRSRRAARMVAVDDVSFSLEPARTLAVVGESGAGKSTIGRMVVRLIEPDSGSIRFDGIDLRSLSRKELLATRSKMQMIFQNPAGSFDPRIPVGVSVAEPLKVQSGMNRSDRERKTLDLLRRVGLSDEHGDRMPRQLSGGQLQRASIARALTLDPKLIVCDEPVTALDVSVRAQVLNLLLDLQEERSIAYLFIAHDLAIVETFCDEVLVMKSGRIVEAGPTTQVFAAPREEYTKSLLDAIPVADPTRRRVRTSTT